MGVLDNLRIKKCSVCGAEITNKNFKPPFLKVSAPRGFYGNRPIRFMPAQCDCGEKYVAYIQPVGNGFKVVDLAKEDSKIIAEKKIEKVEEKVEPEVKEIVVSDEELKLRFEIFLDEISRGELLHIASTQNFDFNIAHAKSDLLKEKLLERATRDIMMSLLEGGEDIEG
jgi:hypothetical protein